MKRRLKDIDAQRSELAAIEKRYRYLEAHKKVLAAKLFMKFEGAPNVATREAMTYSSPEWEEFSKSLAEAETQFNDALRIRELLNQKFMAESQTFKHNMEDIRRGVG